VFLNRLIQSYSNIADIAIAAGYRVNQRGRGINRDIAAQERWRAAFACAPAPDEESFILHTSQISQQLILIEASYFPKFTRPNL